MPRTDLRLPRAARLSPALALAALTLLAACKQEEAALDPAAVARGEELAQSCAGCHTLTGSQNMTGPTLKGVIGRKIGTAPRYDYSEGMKNSDLTWTPEQLVSFLRDPFATFPDTKMGIGEMSEAEATDVVTYIRSLAK